MGERDCRVSQSLRISPHASSRRWPPKHAWQVERKPVWEGAVNQGLGEDWPSFGEAIAWEPLFVRLVGRKLAREHSFGTMELWVQVLLMCS